MRILHVTQYCHAGSIGGTERYVLDLIRGLKAAEIKSVIGWLRPGGSNETLESDGVRIVTLPAGAMRVDSPPAEFESAAMRLLETEKPDWLHFHTFGLTEAALASLAHRRGIRYAFTYHSPAWSCRRETMLLFGQEPCDGEVRAWRCSACQSQERLCMGPAAGHLATGVSAALGWAVLPLSATKLRRRFAFFYDSARYARILRRFLGECGLVVSCCDWSGPVLRRNGAREHAMVHCPQGVPNAVAEAVGAEPTTTKPRSSQGNEAQIGIGDQLEPPHVGCYGFERASTYPEFVVGYVGRVVEIKGVQILMEGFSSMEGREARLRIVGWEPDQSHLPYARRLKIMAEADSRIELLPKRSFDETLAEYARLTLLAIPSTWMETGPLTLLEALALGVPVYGSNRLGQLNLLRKHGRIVEPNTPAGWQAALSGALQEFRDGRWPTRHDRTRSNARLRSMADVAAEMAAHYRVASAN